MNHTDDIDVIDVDIRNYAKYILKDDTDLEKRELLGYLKIGIILKEKQIIVTK